MFGRHSMLLVMLAGAVGIPYLSTSSRSIMDSVSGLWGRGGQDSSASSASNPSGPSVGTAPNGGPTPPGARADHDALPLTPVASANTNRTAPTTPLAEVLRFENSPAWIMSRWPRVSAGLAEIDLQGYRVPLVTGTAYDDVAGSLTYYFSKDEKLQRIVFRGSTGDPRRLVGLITSQYKLRREITSDPNLILFQAKWNGKAHSELRIRPARVVRADVPYSRYEIDLALKRP